MKVQNISEKPMDWMRFFMTGQNIAGGQVEKEPTVFSLKENIGKDSG